MRIKHTDKNITEHQKQLSRGAQVQHFSPSGNAAALREADFFPLSPPFRILPLETEKKIVYNTVVYAYLRKELLSTNREDMIT